MHWFKYFFTCPYCGKIIDSGNDLLCVANRELIPRALESRHVECPKCHKPFSADTNIEFTVDELKRTGV
jgi:transposase